jgi:hypothetical protein
MLFTVFSLKSIPDSVEPETYVSVRSLERLVAMSFLRLELQRNDCNMLKQIGRENVPPDCYETSIVACLLHHILINEGTTSMSLTAVDEIK